MAIHKSSFVSKDLVVAASNTISNSISYFNDFLESRKFPFVVVLLIYVLSMVFTSPTRHGADRYYVLALDILNNHSFNINELVEDKNHYAIVTVDVFYYHGNKYINMHPGQALWGLPGLYIYQFIRRINDFSDAISINPNAQDKSDFIFGTFAMNSTSSAAFTAVTALFFIYLVAKSSRVLNKKIFKISVFIFLFYLSTPLLYYSTHIVQNQSESCLTFWALGILCLSIISEGQRKMYYFVAGIVIGLAFLTNLSSLVLIPYGIMHIALNGFADLDLQNFKNLPRNILQELSFNWKRKIRYLTWLLIGLCLPLAVLLYYQYMLFSNPFRSVHAFLFEIPKTYSPTLFVYGREFFWDIWQNLFSPQVGLFSYTPLLLFPFLIISLRFGSAENQKTDVDASDVVLQRVLFRTMLTILPLYVSFYGLSEGKWGAEHGSLYLNGFNVYSARHILPTVLPIGYLLFYSLLKIGEFHPTTKWVLWSLIIVLWTFSLITNISAMLIGDWIFGMKQVWGYAFYLSRFGLRGLLGQGRSLVDW